MNRGQISGIEVVRKFSGSWLCQPVLNIKIDEETVKNMVQLRSGMQTRYREYRVDYSRQFFGRN